MPVFLPWSLDDGRLCLMLHSDIIPEHGCNGELVPVPGETTEGHGVYCCARCGTEFSFDLEAGSTWVTCVLPGMRIEPKV
jgi:DNA-directed RNA polymerase subunit RPC12/RpoP